MGATNVKILCLLLLGFASGSTLATTISYQQTYPNVALGSTIIGLDLVSQLEATKYGNAYANGTESIANSGGDFIAFDRISNIYQIDKTGKQTLLLDVKENIGSGYINNGSQLGLQYALPHPEYTNTQANGGLKIYTSTTESINPDLNATLFALPSDVGASAHHFDVVSEWDLSGSIPTRSVLMVIETPYNDHNARWLGFDSQENLYISVGDGGNTYKTLGDQVALHGFGQRTESPLGSILRIKPDGLGGYEIPTSNPFVNEANIIAEKYASGLRNPQHCWFDDADNLFCGDIGQRLAEEVNQVVAGGNYGWAVREGNYCIVLSDQDQAEICATDPNYIDPLYAYAHISNAFGSENRAIGGVALCQSCGISELEGFFINVDLASGAMMAFDPINLILNELLFKDLQTGEIGSYNSLSGLARVEARLGSCIDNFLCFTSRVDDNIYRLTSTIHVPTPPNVSIIITFILLCGWRKKLAF